MPYIPEPLDLYDMYTQNATNSTNPYKFCELSKCVNIFLCEWKQCRSTECHKHGSSQTFQIRTYLETHFDFVLRWNSQWSNDMLPTIGRCRTLMWRSWEIHLVHGTKHTSHNIQWEFVSVSVDEPFQSTISWVWFRHKYNRNVQYEHIILFHVIFSQWIWCCRWFCWCAQGMHLFFIPQWLCQGTFGYGLGKDVACQGYQH